MLESNSILKQEHLPNASFIHELSCSFRPRLFLFKHEDNNYKLSISLPNKFLCKMVSIRIISLFFALLIMLLRCFCSLLFRCLHCTLRHFGFYALLIFFLSQIRTFISSFSGNNHDISR